jgi:hypothetical protein
MGVELQGSKASWPQTGPKREGGAPLDAVDMERWADGRLACCRPPTATSLSQRSTITMMVADLDNIVT